MLEPRLDEKIAFLVAHHAESLGHLQASLLEHLMGTAALLGAWGADQTLCDAGLFHSVYGTESYGAVLIPLALRPAVCRLIGEDAEHTAYLFGVMSKSTFYD